MMKRTWTTPELKELTWDKTMSGYYSKTGNETTNYPCFSAQGDANLSEDGFIQPYPNACLLSS